MLQTAQPQMYNALGVIWSLLVQSAVHCTLRLDCALSLALPSVVAKQFYVYMDDDGPCGYVTWAWLDDATSAQMYNEQCVSPFADWTSGRNLWIVDLVSVRGRGKDIIRYVLDELFPYNVIHAHRRRDGVYRGVVRYRGRSA